MDITLEYYNKNAEKFIHGTLYADMHLAQDKFLKLLADNGQILDFGCGSGRDTKYFMDRGYNVTATDGSAELCKAARKYTGIDVKQMLFQELNDVDAYDGIWACASILHLSKLELSDVLKKMSVALKNKGIIYTSFKYGSFEGQREDRYFTDFSEEGFRQFVAQIPELTIIDSWITNDVRPGRENEQWLNLLLQKR